MFLKNSFSRRRKSKICDVFVYDEMPQKLRMQVAHILSEVFGAIYILGNPSDSHEILSLIVRTARKEAGVNRLFGGVNTDVDDEFYSWILNTNDFDCLIDIIEMTMQIIDDIDKSGRAWMHSEASPSDAISELNSRFLEAGFGYQYINSQIIRIDNTFAHSEMVVPALILLSNDKFSAASSEFRQAHDFYRNGHYSSSITECGKSLESVLKTIGAALGWSINKNDTASKLIAAAFSASFIPEWMQAEFNALRSLLEAGTPVMRNKLGAHGAGTPREIPARFVAFQLHQTAAAIIFLVETFNAASER